MSHEIHRVTSFQKVAQFILRVDFNDGTSQVIDFRPVLKGDLYGPLQEPSLFDRVTLDNEVHWYGQTALTSIRQSCTTGPNQVQHSRSSYVYYRHRRALVSVPFNPVVTDLWIPLFFDGNSCNVLDIPLR